MNSFYFRNGRPDINKIINDFLSIAHQYQINIESIALVGGWARAARDSGFDCNDEAANPIDLQVFINKSSKYGGDVDFVIFLNDIEPNLESILSKHLNADIQPEEKDGRIDIVLSLPAKVRLPGIKLITNSAL